jgi:quinol monooxygenase YgiN
VSVVVVAFINPHPEHHADVARALAELVPAVHEENGCELYAIHDSGTALVVVEQWATGEDLEQHASGQAVLEMKQQQRGKLASPVSITVAAAIPAGSAAKGMLRAV